MSNHLVSVDAGNGGTNAVRRMKRGKDRYVYFPSVRAAASGDSLGIGDLELDYEFYDWNAHRFVVGDDIVHITRRAVERHHGEDRYGGEFHQFLAAVALHRLGIKNGQVDITLFAPPGMYKAGRERILDNFGNDGEVRIAARDGKEYCWQYDRVEVLPEGVGAALCFAIDANGDMVNHDALAGDVLILDLGMYTGDALLLKNGKFSPEDLQHATWDNAGLASHVLNPILAQLKKMSPDYAVTTIDDVDLALRVGLKIGDYIVRSGGTAVDIKPMLDKLTARYAGWLMNNIISGVFNGLRGIKSLIIVGGGTMFVMDAFQNEYNRAGDRDRILDPREHPLTLDLHPVDMNAVGGLRFGLMKQRACE
ncbi:MAG: ParM/StbA family protein [Chloroflexota bacterium]